MQVSLQQIVTGFTDWQRAEAHAIRRLIRASNAASIARHRAQAVAEASQGRVVQIESHRRLDA